MKNKDLIEIIFMILFIILIIIFVIKASKDCNNRGGRLVRGYCISSEVIKWK